MVDQTLFGLGGVLEPDLLGEALVHRVLSAAGGGRRVLRTVFEGAEARAIETGLVVLGRAPCVIMGPSLVCLLRRRLLGRRPIGVGQHDQ